MPVPCVYQRNVDDFVPDTLRSDVQTTPTITGDSGHTGALSPPSTVAGNPDHLSPGIIGAIVTVPIVVVVCMVAAVLHLLSCTNPRCKACLLLRYRKRKPRGDQASHDRQLSDVETSPRSLYEIPDTLEKSGFDIIDCSQLDQQFRTDSGIGSTLTTQPRSQEIGGDEPRYFYPHSIASNLALTATPPLANSTPTAPVVAPTPLRSIEKSDRETVERPVEGETHSPPDLDIDTENLDTARPRSRCSQASGLLSIITLPSFISNDRPRTYSSSGVARIESPVRPTHNLERSFLGRRFSGTGAVPPATPIEDESDTGGMGSRPASGALQIITSALKSRRSSTSSTRSSSPLSRRSSRRFLGRLNLSLGTEEEAAIEWNRLPRLPSAHSTSATQTPQSCRATRAENSPTEQLPSHREEEPNLLPYFLAPLVPLPPSPSTEASPVSSISLVHAFPSPPETPPINCSTAPQTSYPPLPPSSYRGSTFSAFSQRSPVHELVLPPPRLMTPRSSPSRPTSPRGPRPLPVPGQLSWSATLYSRGSSTGQ